MNASIGVFDPGRSAAEETERLCRFAEDLLVLAIIDSLSDRSAWLVARSPHRPRPQVAEMVTLSDMTGGRHF